MVLIKLEIADTIDSFDYETIVFSTKFGVIPRVDEILWLSNNESSSEAIKRFKTTAFKVIGVHYHFHAPLLDIDLPSVFLTAIPFDNV